jgi:DNA-binding NtrC family response regulator
MRSPFARVADFLRRNKVSPTRHWPLPAAARPLSRLTVIALISGDADRRELTSICARKGWNLAFAGTLEEARTVLDKVRAPVILCDRDLPGSGWRSTIEGLASSRHRACIILVSAVVDSYLWNEVVRTGGFDILSKPFREDDVASAVRLAWSYWNQAAKPSGDQEIATSASELSGEEEIR